MTQHELYQTIARQFPHLTSIEHRVLSQTIAPLSFLELKALMLTHQTNETMKQVLDYAIKQREAEAEISYLEDRYFLWDEYYHCCGSW